MSCVCPLRCSWPFQYFPWKHARAFGQDDLQVEKKNLAKGKFSLQTVSRWCLGPISSWLLHVCITQARSAIASLRGDVLAFLAFWLQQNVICSSMTPLEPVKGLRHPASGLQTRTWALNSLIPDNHKTRSSKVHLWKGFAKLRLAAGVCATLKLGSPWPPGVQHYFRSLPFQSIFSSVLWGEYKTSLYLASLALASPFRNYTPKSMVSLP